MSKREKLLDQFVISRVAGLSFDEISKELQVSKQTLLNWAKIEEIKNEE